MGYKDSVDKIHSYMEASNNDEIAVSPTFFRDYTCPANCGGCCKNYTLDYFEGERWELFKKTYPHLIDKFPPRIVDGVTVYTNFNKSKQIDSYCEFLSEEDGRCGIHESNPFTCEFELNKLSVRDKKTYLQNKLFGRGWGMTRVDGTKGAMCEMIPFNLKKYLRDVKLLEELVVIMKKFKKETSLIQRVIDFLNRTKKPIEKQVVFKKTDQPIV